MGATWWRSTPPEPHVVDYPPADPVGQPRLAARLARLAGRRSCRLCAFGSHEPAAWSRGGDHCLLRALEGKKPDLCPLARTGLNLNRGAAIQNSSPRSAPFFGRRTFPPPSPQTQKFWRSVWDAATATYACCSMALCSPRRTSIA